MTDATHAATPSELAAAYRYGMEDARAEITVSGKRPVRAWIREDQRRILSDVEERYLAGMIAALGA